MLRKKFVALQKELSAKKRELEIEASLEKVRARSLAMQSSDELLDAAIILFQQLKKLGVETGSCGFIIWDKKEKQATAWMSSPEGGLQVPFLLPHTQSNIYKEAWAAMQDDADFMVKEVRGEELLKHFDYLETVPGICDVIKKLRHTGYTFPEKMIYHFAYFKQGYLSFHTHEPVPQAHDIFKRFAKVFEQTYTRFLDLQKAEAQAREAKIEAALERVRSQSMAMHHSENLHEVINTLTEQLQQLGFYFDTANFITDYTKNGLYMWVSTPGVTVPSRIYIPFAEVTFSNILNDAVNDNLDFISYTLSFEEKNDFFRHFFENTDGKYIPEERKQHIYNSRGLSASVVLLKNVFLTLANYQAIPYTEDENAIIKRFGNVFGQSYTRFLDLQKAEAQAREAKIEAALERTRTQSMIMQQSKELDDTLRVFHQQVQMLGINSAFSFLWLPDEEKEQHIFWAIWEENLPTGQAGENGSVVFKNKAINYPLDRNEPATRQCLIDWKSDEAVVSYAVPPEGVENYFAAWQELIDGVEKLKPQHFRNGLYYIEAFMKYGCFGVMMETDLNESDKKILSRFAIEFERTYTRFLDLQKAEAQAKEATIEAALERIRSQSLGMQTSKDLSNVTTAMFEQLRMLGGELYATGIVFCDKHKNHVEQWHSVPAAGMLSPFIVPVDLDHIHQYRYDQWKKGEELFSVEIPEDFIAQHFEKMFNLPTVKAVLEDFAAKNIPMPQTPSWEIDYGASFSHGYLLVSALQPFSDAAILPRFAKVFEQTYTRFLDLQKAEAQARESQVQLALERVRARTMAMHQSTELADTSSVLFQQIKELGFETWSCGFCIWQNNDGVEVWMGADSGGLLPPMTIPYKEEPTHNKIYEAHLQGALTHEKIWEGKALEKHYAYLRTIPSVAVAIKVLEDSGLSLPARQCYYVGFFKQGYLLLCYRL